MTSFLSTRCWVTGGPCSDAVTFFDGASGKVTLRNPADFARLVRGRHVVLATHGFNVNQSSGIASLSAWERLYTLPPDAIYIGVLWPGDALLLRVIDYPVEAGVANQSGALLARFLESYGSSAAAYSFVSHSLGARVVLETVAGLSRIQPKNLILMASAIEDDCLQGEFRDAAQQAERVTVVASEQDEVLHLAYPAGNFVSNLLRTQLPNLRPALGRDGPQLPAPANAQGRTWQAPDTWRLGHLNYLPDGGSQLRPVPVPQPKPAAAQAPPVAGSEWRPAWTAAVASTILNSP